jgi:hypothetical protein
MVSGSCALPPRWLPQCSCIVIESSFDPGERLQAPGSLWFHQIFKILILFVLYLKKYKRQMVSWNCKQVQHVKIYLPCNFEVNLITHLGVIVLFSSIFFLILILFVLYFKNYLEIDVKFKLQKCAACQDLPTLQFWSKSHYPFWSYCPF